MYKVISFDIGGTLIDMESNNNYNMGELVKLLDLPKNDVRKAYKDVFQKKKGTLLELVELFCKMLNISVDDRIIKFFTDKYSDEFNKSVIKPESISVIQELRNMGYRIILLSNSCCLIKSGLNEDILSNVDRVFYSYDLGYTKDDREIYRIVEDEIDCKSNEILHIGDTLGSDYLRPKENGWDALYYGKTEDEDVVSIFSLSDILDILRGNGYGKKGINVRRTS